MSPGLAVNKSVLSSRDLLEFSSSVQSWSSSQVLEAMISSNSNLSSESSSFCIENAKMDNGESLLNLLCFGSKEVTFNH